MTKIDDLISYEDFMNRFLQDPEVLEEYLNEALKEDDVRVFLLALRNIARATKGGLAGFAKKTGYSRQTLYKTLSEKGNPTWKSLHTFLNAAGFQLKVEAIKKKPAKRKKAADRGVAA